MLIQNGRVHDGLYSVAMQDIRIIDGIITRLGAHLEPEVDEEVFNAAGLEILPGFIHALSGWGVNGLYAGNPSILPGQ